MKHKRAYQIIWFPTLLNRLVIYTVTMTGFMLIFYLSAGRQEFSDRTVNGIIELTLIYSVSSFFFACWAIGGRLLRNRYVSHLKKRRIFFLLLSMLTNAVVIVFFSFLIVLQTGYGY